MRADEAGAHASAAPTGEGGRNLPGPRAGAKARPAADGRTKPEALQLMEAAVERNNMLCAYERVVKNPVFVKSPQGDSAEDQLLVPFQGMIAEYERAQILERSRRAKRHRAQSGEVSVMSNAPYGYRYIRKTDEAPAAYLVEEAEARVVRRVYEMYTVEGLSIGEITRRINAEASRLARQARAGNARPFGQCCATPPIAASPASARPASLHGRGLCAHSVAGV
jgi:hypothetical protein